ncbi:hybrid sensor histidine kinase/response regulator [Ramlibacter sp. AN1133]|uniref:hybrid sensor histidine kinase/response regulator n=1 Tax=Ramlibacter sp. AN1133 TaxID=3133429 RepID=UPI0030C44429
MQPTPPPAFLAGDSAMARLMRGHDWAGTAVGAPAGWPQSLRSVVNLMLGSGFPMFVAWGADLEMLYNDAYAEILGRKHPASLGTPFERVWYDILDDIMPFVRRALAGETFFIENLPLRMRRKGEEEDTWFTFSYSPVLDEEGRTAGFYCACAETTATVLGERHQRAEQERLQALFAQAPGFVCVTRGPEHVYEVVNPRYLQLINHRQVLGQRVRDALPEVVEQGYVSLLDRVYRTGEAYVGRSARVTLEGAAGAPATEAFVDFVYQPLRDAQGHVYGIFTHGHDVTEQQRAQEALLAFSNSIPAIAWEASPDGLVERFNSQWQATTGQPQERALGHGWTEALHPEDKERVADAWERSREAASEWTAEMRLRGHDGSWRWFLTRAVPQRDAAGRVLRWFGTTTDIDDARRATQALQAADRQKDEFLATLAHELRNPLAPLRSAVHLLSMPAAPEKARARAVEIVGRQVSHMARLLDDLIDIARITQRRLVLKPEWVRVQAVVDSAMEAAAPTAQAKRHALAAHVPDPQQWLRADPVRIAQVLSNLLNNACKYTDAGGSITLDVASEGDEIVFTVTDTGIGMSPQALENVFAMFAQEQSALERSEGGLGIGLALAKGLVELHGGSIRAHSEGLGAGSRFEVRLPHAVRAEDGGEAAPAPVPASGRGRVVLLADDNQDAAEVLAELLRLAGHEVHVASNGTAAAGMAARVQPQVLVLDIGMPGLNGYEVARQVRTQAWGRSALLVAATGWGQEEDRRQAMAAGFDLHFTKPFPPEQLLASIAALPR